MPINFIPTRFRAYKLGQAGGSFSLYANGIFTLIEARITDLSRTNLEQELIFCGKSTIDVLHITSWDNDHCSLEQLKEIVSKYHPTRIEYPGYLPHTQSAKECLNFIHSQQYITCIALTQNYILSLYPASLNENTDVSYCLPYNQLSKSNDMSTVQLFRRGTFNVASLGDIESVEHAKILMNNQIFSNEVDVLILAHHGADCETNSFEFFKKVRPQIAICSSQYDNQFEHPKPEVKQRLYNLNIPLMTTKTGDVIITSLPKSPHAIFVRNFGAQGQTTSQLYLTAKKNFIIEPEFYY